MAASDMEELTLAVKWTGREYSVRVCGDDTITELKRRICEATNVLPKRQKLLGLKVGTKQAEDSNLVAQCTIKPGARIMMMGSLEEDILVEPVDAPELIDDLEINVEESLEIKDRLVNQQKLQRRIKQYKIRVRNEPRPGKKLLVLDIDYTLFDHRSTAENALELMRPYLHEFLAASYAEYDIIIWSATSMRWVEAKMRDLGVLDNASYKIVALMDHMAMITVQSDKYGVFDCKPLGVVWESFPGTYHAGNTIMFDDLRRNFVMNPQNGLVIRPFRNAHANRATDRELADLTQYLLAIAELASLSQLDHSKWNKFMATAGAGTRVKKGDRGDDGLAEQEESSSRE